MGPSLAFAPEIIPLAHGRLTGVAGLSEDESPGQTPFLQYCAQAPDWLRRSWRARRRMGSPIATTSRVTISTCPEPRFRAAFPPRGFPSGCAASIVAPRPLSRDLVNSIGHEQTLASVLKLVCCVGWSGRYGAQGRIYDAFAMTRFTIVL